MSEEKVVFGDRYLRNRPFLVINQVGKPAKNTKTEVAGWKEHGLRFDEVPFLVDRVSDKIMSEATIIIDVLNSKIVKNRFVTADDEAVVAYYLEKYSSQVQQGVQAWNKMVGVAV